MLICHLRAHLEIVKIHKEKVFITQIGHHVVGFHINMTIEKNIHRRRDALIIKTSIYWCSQKLVIWTAIFPILGTSF